MWSPTHVQVTVQKSRSLILKGKNGTNDAFVTIGLGKEKYQTSIKEKASDRVEWHEKCELQIPKQGNRAEIFLTALHHNFLGVDEFLGAVSIPLAELDVYERPKNKWYKLKDKPGKVKNKDRGELEIKVAFIVKAGSLADLSKKEKHHKSLSNVTSSFSGSLISVSSLDKRKGLKKLASKIGHKVGTLGRSKEKEEKDSHSSEYNKPGWPNSSRFNTRQIQGDADPGVVSDAESDDEFMLDELSHKGSGCSLDHKSGPVVPSPAPAPRFTMITPALDNSVPGSLDTLSEDQQSQSQRSSLSSLAVSVTSPPLPISTPPTKPPRSLFSNYDEWEQKLYGKLGKGRQAEKSLRRSSINLVLPTEETSHSDVRHPLSATSSPIPCRHRSQDKSSYSVKKGILERIIIGGEAEKHSSNSSRFSSELLKKFDGKSREDLIELILELELRLNNKIQEQKDLEDYLDNLLLRVMETSPRILQNPYLNCKTQAQLI